VQLFQQKKNPKKMSREISAKVVADSINSQGVRITTFVVVFPRFILAEFNTHRMFSRNSASSRARPFKTMLKDVMETPFIPIAWMAAHKGMQGTAYLNEEESAEAKKQWLLARDKAVASAVELDRLQVTKQFVNRLLEPFLWHEVIVTATEYGNFFALRAHPDAEIHICKLAQQMLQAYNASIPKKLTDGEWHIPFGDNIDEARLSSIIQSRSTSLSIKAEDALNDAKMAIACARCARISYKTFGSEQDYDYQADCKLFQSLVDGGHMSPLEHCARAMTHDEREKQNNRSGNFTGFIQYRKLFQDENRIDSRVINKT
jgi:thymidylate synthase ThyX